MQKRSRVAATGRNIPLNRDLQAFTSSFRYLTTRMLVPPGSTDIISINRMSCITRAMTRCGMYSATPEYRQKVATVVFILSARISPLALQKVLKSVQKTCLTDAAIIRVIIVKTVHAAITNRCAFFSSSNAVLPVFNSSSSFDSLSVLIPKFVSRTFSLSSFSLSRSLHSSKKHLVASSSRSSEELSVFFNCFCNSAY